METLLRQCGAARSLCDCGPLTHFGWPTKPHANAASRPNAARCNVAALFSCFGNNHTEGSSVALSTFGSLISWLRFVFVSKLSCKYPPPHSYTHTHNAASLRCVAFNHSEAVRIPAVGHVKVTRAHVSPRRVFLLPRSLQCGRRQTAGKLECRFRDNKRV